MALSLKFFLEPIAITDVQRLHRLELGEQIAGLFGVVAVALKIGDQLTLTGKMLLTLGDVPFRQCQMFCQYGAIHSGPPTLRGGPASACTPAQ